MTSRPSPTPSFDEPTEQSIPWSATGAFDPASSTLTLARMSDPPSENGDQRIQADPLLAPLLSTSAPHRRTAATGFTPGVLSYLLSIGLVAAVIMAVCFGGGFLSLRHSTEEIIAISGTGDRGSAVKPPLLNGLSYPNSAALPHSETLAFREASPAGTGDPAQSLVETFSASATPVSAADGASSTVKVPGSKSTRPKARTKRVQTARALRAKSRGGTLTPPVETGPVLRSTAYEATLTPPIYSGPALRSTRRNATLTPPGQIEPMFR
jgi:hypothetical protein